MPTLPPKRAAKSKKVKQETVTPISKTIPSNESIIINVESNFREFMKI